MRTVRLVLAVLAASVAATQVVTAQGGARPHFIPGLSVARVYLRLKSGGFTCHGPAKLRGAVGWLCEKHSPFADFVVDAVGVSPSEIETVTASIVVHRGDFYRLAAAFLGSVAAL